MTHEESTNTPSAPDQEQTVSTPSPDVQMGAGDGMTRRDLIVPAAAAFAFTIVPRHVLGQTAYSKAPSDKLNIAGVGVGDMGGNYLEQMQTENIVALADVDFAYASDTFDEYPKAKTYKDFRVLLDKEKNIDAVVIGTPDHAHALVTMHAIQAGKHVYCAKPMCRTVAETRKVTKAARDAKIVTQVSTQSGFSEAAQSTAEILKAGIIGKVHEIHVSTDRPIWPQGIGRPTGNFPVPKTLDWDLWLAGAPVRPYNPLYHPFNWRAFYDFGTGALGDFAPHLWNYFWDALQLTYPTRVSSSLALQDEIVTGAAAAAIDGPEQVKSKKTKYAETFPIAEIITFEFPQRGSMPPLRMVWYDGNLLPPRPLGYDPSFRAPTQYFVGDKGVLIPGNPGPGGGRAQQNNTQGGGRGPAPVPAGGGGGRGRGIPGTNAAMSGNQGTGPRGNVQRQAFLLLVDGKETEFQTPPKTLPRTIGHYKEFIVAAKGGPPTNCSFNYQCLINETLCLGVIAQRIGVDIVYDSAKMEITNSAEANELLRQPVRPGWEV